MSSGITDQRWYAVHVRPHCEKSVAAHLRECGQETFLPLYKVRTNDSCIPYQAQTPLFPGYVFCRMDWQRGPRLYLIPGILGVVGIGRKPVPIEDAEIEAVRRIGESEASPKPCPFGLPGIAVRVIKGPLAGIEGIVQKRLAHEIVVSVSLLRRSVAVKVEPAWLAIINESESGAACMQAELPVMAQKDLMQAITA
jgi:transcriptional antiterminator RfaH